MATPQSVRFLVDGEQSVSALLLAPPRARACLVLAHGAGAGMTHPFLETVANGLADRGIATFRFQFPYMERGSKRPDSPAIAHATVRAAINEAGRRLPDLPLFAGGKSFGGRMTSQAQAASPLPGVRGLVFIGFPLHPVGKPDAGRAEHLFNVTIPMLFLQGTRDALAHPEQLRPVIDQLRGRATLRTFDQADHSFHVPARSGHTDAQVMTELLDATEEWMTARKHA